MPSYGRLQAVRTLPPKARRAGTTVAVGANPRDPITHPSQWSWNRVAVTQKAATSKRDTVSDKTRLQTSPNGASFFFPTAHLRHAATRRAASCAALDWERRHFVGSGRNVLRIPPITHPLTSPIQGLPGMHSAKAVRPRMNHHSSKRPGARTSSPQHSA